jgi:hypothetical protein
MGPMAMTMDTSERYQLDVSAIGFGAAQHPGRQIAT